MNNKKLVVCLGDSTTFGFPYGPPDSWVAMLADTLANYRFINQGVNGDTTGGMLQRFEHSVVRYNPDYVIITGGINDVVIGESFDRICTNLHEMVMTAQQAGIKVILGFPSAVDEPHWERILVRIRKWLYELSSQLSLGVIDFSAAFYDEKGQLKTELLLPDGGHPTREGYRRMFAQIDLSMF